MHTFVLTLVAVLALSTQGSEQPDVRFKWAFGVLPANGSKLTRVVDAVRVSAGDEYRMFVQPLTQCFVYVLHQDPEKRLKVLFPSADGTFPSRYGRTSHYIPEGAEWLKVGVGPGTELVYLIASSSRLSRLESILSRHAAATAATRPAIAAEAMAEISTLRQQQARAVWSERPLTMGGTVSRGGPDVAAIASDVEGRTFLSRVFILNRR